MDDIADINEALDWHDELEAEAHWAAHKNAERR
jgi:hypothetical protein